MGFCNWEFLAYFSVVFFSSWCWFLSLRHHTAGLNNGLSVEDISDLGSQLFWHRNGTLLSPENQDRRWEEFSLYYKQLQERLTSKQREYYVIYTTTYSGLANKLNGMISGLLLAMATGRGFQLDDWDSFDSYFHLPLVNHHYFANSTRLRGKNLIVWRACVESKRLKQGKMNDYFGFGNIRLYTNCPLFRSLAKNDEYYSTFVNRGLVRTAKRGEYDKIADEIYFRLLHFFSLEKSIQATYEQIKTSWENHFVVGMQIRVGIGNGNFADNCKFLFASDVQTFIHYAQYYTNRTTLKPIWFVSTDSPDVEMMFKQQYADRVFTLDSFPMKHTKTLAYSYGDPAVKRAILDNYLLSQSDLLLTTNWSSFGEMAMGRMEKGNTIVITRSDPIIHPPPLVTFNRT